MSYPFQDDHNASPPAMDGEGSHTVALRLVTFVLPVARPAVAVIEYLLPHRGCQIMNVFLKRLLQPGSFSGYGMIIAALTIFGIPEEVATTLTETAGPFILAMLGVLKIGMDDKKWL